MLRLRAIRVHCTRPWFEEGRGGKGATIEKNFGGVDTVLHRRRRIKRRADFHKRRYGLTGVESRALAQGGEKFVLVSRIVLDGWWRESIDQSWFESVNWYRTGGQYRQIASGSLMQVLARDTDFGSPPCVTRGSGRGLFAV